MVINCGKTWICTRSVEFFNVLLYADLNIKTDNKIILYCQLLYCILIVIIRHSKRQYWCAKHNNYSICTLLNLESSNQTFSSDIERKAHCEERQREDEGTAIYIYLMRVNLASVGGANSCTLSMNLCTNTSQYRRNNYLPLLSLRFLLQASFSCVLL